MKCLHHARHRIIVLKHRYISQECDVQYTVLYSTPKGPVTHPACHHTYNTCVMALYSTGYVPQSPSRLEYKCVSGSRHRMTIMWWSIVIQWPDLSLGYVHNRAACIQTFGRVH